MPDALSGRSAQELRRKSSGLKLDRSYVESHGAPLIAPKDMTKGGEKSSKAQTSTKSKESKVKDEKAQATPQLPAKVSKRPYSIVVWGASGFTGELLCEQITQKYPVRFSSWACVC